MKKKIAIGVGLVVALFVAYMGWYLATGGPLLDLRPADLDTSESSSAKGRAVLERAFEEAGGEQAWFAVKGGSFTMRDEWPGMMSIFSPWPSGDVTVDGTFTRHTFDMEVAFVTGAEPPLAWRMRAGQAAVKTNGDWLPTDDANIRFMLPTMHYFLEAPQRLLEAELVAYVGREDLGGRTYDVVFVTWGTWEATETYDQYFAYVDVESGRLDKLYYTVREIMPSVSGTMHYADFRDIEGLPVPFDMTVTSLPTDDPSDYLHKVTLSAFAWTR